MERIRNDDDVLPDPVCEAQNERVVPPEVGELHRHPSAEGLAHDGGVLDAEHNYRPDPTGFGRGLVAGARVRDGRDRGEEPVAGDPPKLDPPNIILESGTKRLDDTSPSRN